MEYCLWLRNGVSESKRDLKSDFVTCQFNEDMDILLNPQALYFLIFLKDVHMGTG